MLRLFALRFPPADAPTRRRALQLLARLTDRTWRVAIDRRGVILQYATCDNDLPPVVLPDECGLIIGALFRRGDGESNSRAVAELNVRDMSEEGREAIYRDYWGSCAMFLHDRFADRLEISREPAAGRPVYWANAGDRMLAICTHIGDYARVFDTCAVDDRQVSAFLAHPRMVAPATAVQGVRELLAGQRMAIGRDGSVSLDCSWRPLPNGREFTAHNSEDAGATLRRAVWDSAAAWASLDAPIAHRLSGGLDSSIVLSALCRERPGSVVCLNEFPVGCPEGDERRMARIVAEHFGCPLVEAEAHAAKVDYRALGCAEVSARPSLSDISFADSTIVRAAQSAGAVILTSGQGGDQLFHRARTPGIAVEAVRDRLPAQEVWEIAFDTARLARRPIWDIFESVWRDQVRRLREAPYDAAFARASFASAEARAAAMQSWSEHPWWSDIRRAGPARAARIVHIADLEYYRQYSAVTTSLVSAPILASLPVLETVVRIPPYVMTHGGRERALVRDAFARELPEAVLQRTLKGSTTRYHNRVFERQLPFIREVLIGGELCRRGLVDAARLETALAQDVLPNGPIKSALTTAFTAEMWIRRFLTAKAMARGQSAETVSPPSAEDMASG